MRKDLLAFLYGDTVMRESSQTLGEQVVRLFEEAADTETEQMVASKQPLAAALKEIGINGDLEACAQACELSCDNASDYRENVRLLFDPENMHKLAEKGWVPVKSGDVAMTFEPANFKIGFIEIDTAETSASDKVPDAEKIRKEAQKFASTEVDRDDDLNPVEFDDKTSKDRQKGVGDAKDGAKPEGKPKGSTKSESKLQEYGGHYCPSCCKPCPGHEKDGKLCCDHCGSPLQYPKSNSLRSREMTKGKAPSAKQVAESLLEMTSASSVPCVDSPAPVMMGGSWTERVKRANKRRANKPVKHEPQ